MEQSSGFLADEVEAAAVVDVLDVVPGDALSPVLLLQGDETQRKENFRSVNTLRTPLQRCYMLHEESNEKKKNKAAVLLDIYEYSSWHQL